jgi:hypothetical protein
MTSLPIFPWGQLTPLLLPIQGKSAAMGQFEKPLGVVLASEHHL